MKNNTQPALKERIEKALEDFTKGRASMHVPPLDTDVDVVLAECSDRLSELKARCAALAAENAGLKAAFDKPQAYLSWHTIPPTWEDPLPCGEYLDVHDDAGHKNSDGTDCWPVYAKPEINTPATDAFLTEVRAQGVEIYADNLDSSADDAERDGFDDAVKFLRSEASGVRLFAAQLRKGVQS
ncbi:coiled-coil domain-containing protein [Enterobacter kobei]|uniref:hypothetical protein n=1 Tax=Enterobacter kobei TaxID=208224 RepID=UPI0021C8D43B|nr:hypothetical protein [Enterobacter kobei]MCU2432462.1 hypothetical protein [Enterobacter kobei]